MISIRQELMSAEEVRIVREWLNSQGARIFQEHIASTAALASADAVNKELDWPEDAENDDNIEAAKRLNAAKLSNAFNAFISLCRGKEYPFYRAKLEPIPVATVESAEK